MLEAYPELVQTTMAAYEKWWTEVRPLMVNDGIEPEKGLYYRTDFRKQEREGGIPDWAPPDFE